MKEILIVEDEDKMRKIIKNYLVKEGFKVTEAADGEEGLMAFETGNFDLAVLDVMMPRIDGWTLCRMIRKESKLPIIMLTARSAEDDELFGFDLGADEYITKPFSLKILLARKGEDEGTGLVVGEIIVDERSHRITYRGEILELTPKEYEMLVFMIKNKDTAITRERFLNQIWGYDYYGDLRTVDTHVKQLRRKLENQYIKTVRGIGYRFESE